MGGPGLDHSQAIRVGIGFEESLVKICCDHSNNLLQFFPKKRQYYFIDGNQVDSCFEKDDSIYVFEIKSNLNLDTEKSKATDNKLQRFYYHLKEKYPNKEIKPGILIPYWEYIDIIKKTNKCKSDIYSMKDFFKILGISMTQEEYKEMLFRVGEKI